MPETTLAAGKDLDLEAGSVLLAELTADVAAAERLIARAVAAVGRLAGSGVAERVEGLTLDMVLATACGLTGSTRGVLVTAGETLRTLPATAAAFADGQLTWGQVQRIVWAARKVDVARRAALDARIAATGRIHGFDRYDPDALCDEIDVAADELRALRNVERAEQRRHGADVLVLQQSFDGMVTGWFRLNPVAAAILVNALTYWMALLAKGSVTPPATGGDPAVPNSDDPRSWTGRDRGRQQATALLTMAAAALAGMLAPGGHQRPAKPLYIIHVDRRHARPTAVGTLELDLPGGLPTLTGRLVELLGTDATIRAVLFDGHRPLAVTAKLHAQDIPTDTRLAVTARDLGNRDPGPRLPPGRSHLHHLLARDDGGDHHVDNLACVGAAWHLRHVHPKHTDGWDGHLDPATGAITWTRPRPDHHPAPPGHPPPPTCRQPVTKRPARRPPRRRPSPRRAAEHRNGQPVRRSPTGRRLPTASLLRLTRSPRTRPAPNDRPVASARSRPTSSAVPDR